MKNMEIQVSQHICKNHTKEKETISGGWTIESSHLDGVCLFFIKKKIHNNVCCTKEFIWLKLNYGMDHLKSLIILTFIPIAGCWDRIKQKKKNEAALWSDFILCLRWCVWMTRMSIFWSRNTIMLLQRQQNYQSERVHSFWKGQELGKGRSQ